MSGSETTIEAVRAFLRFLEGDNFGNDVPRQLEAELDALASAVTSSLEAFDEVEYPEPPGWNYVERRERIAKRFPFLGKYNDVDPWSEPLGRSEVTIADSVDDLVDIWQELTETMWRTENTSLEDALWHLTFTFRSHWGQHLRGLQRYLLER